MRVLQAWKDSLSLFSPENLKLFLLVTLNAFVKGYAVLIKSAWPFVLPLIALWAFVFKFTFTPASMGQVMLTTVAQGLIYYCFFFLWCVATRPSVERKSIAYFLFYLKRFWYHIPILYILGMLLGMFGIFVQIFFMFFILDSDGSIRSLWLSCVRALKMAWYNLPASLITSLVLGVLFNLLSWPIFFFGKEQFGLSFVLAILLTWGILVPFEVCFFGSYYIKKLHDQFDLYFQQL